MAHIINLTPHNVVLLLADGSTRTIESSGIARVQQTLAEIGEIDGISISSTRFGEVEGLPEPQENTFFIVSSIVASASNRSDLLVPGDFVRNSEGQIIGCKTLIRPNEV